MNNIPERNILKRKLVLAKKNLKNGSAASGFESDPTNESLISLSAIAHQWKQPLSALTLLIQDYVHDMRENGEGDVEFLEQQSQSLVNFMSCTVSDFIHFMENPESDEIFDVKDIIPFCLNLFRYRLNHENIKYSVFCTFGVCACVETSMESLCGQNPILIRGRKNNLIHIIINLLSNAIDAILFSANTDRRLEVSLSMNDNVIQICVADTGDGIAIENQDKIFKPFFTTKSKHKGSGLGLYLCKKIIETEFGGSISQCRNNNMTKFAVCLPVKKSGNDIA